MDYISIIIWIFVCDFIVIGICMMVQITKGINRKIKKCDEVREWAKQELNKHMKEVEE